MLQICEKFGVDSRAPFVYIIMHLLDGSKVLRLYWMSRILLNTLWIYSQNSIKRRREKKLNIYLFLNPVTQGLVNGIFLQDCSPLSCCSYGIPLHVFLWSLSDIDTVLGTNRSDCFPMDHTEAFHWDVGTLRGFLYGGGHEDVLVW